MEIDNINLKELSKKELLTIFGGDKFMHDLGYAIGAAISWLQDTWNAGKSGTEYAPKF